MSVAVHRRRRTVAGAVEPGAGTAYWVVPPAAVLNLATVGTQPEGCQRPAIPSSARRCRTSGNRHENDHRAGVQLVVAGCGQVYGRAVGSLRAAPPFGSEPC